MRGYAAIGLDNPKIANNVGSVLRAAGVYGAAFVATSGGRFGHTPTDTMKHYRHMPFIRTDDVLSIVPYDCVPVAVDIIDGARSLFDYVHPERAYYIFGAEDATLGDRIISRCRDVVYIPTSGSMNLAATVNVVLYDRMMKNRNKYG